MPFSTIKAIVILISIGFVVYFNTFFNGFVLDDWLQIVNNAYTHSFGNCISFFFGLGSDKFPYYRPIHACMHSLLFSVFGPSPFYSHLLQVCLHVANASLLFIVLKQFFKAGLAFIIALIFLIHPINSETVNYISALQDTLYFFFGMLSFVIIYMFRLTYKSLFLSSFLLLLSLFTKEAGILFILLINLYILLYKQKRKNFLIYFLSSCAIFAIYFIFRLSFSTTQISIPSLYPIFEASTITRFQTMP